MIKANKLRYLNEIIEQEAQAQATPEPSEDVQDPIPAAISEGIGSCIKEATILTVFEFYVVYLITEEELAVADALAKIEKPISIVHERGDIDVATIKHIKEYLEKYRVGTRMRLRRKANAKFLEHVLINEMGEMLTERNIEFKDCKEFSAVHKLEKALAEAKCQLISKYKRYVMQYRKEFMDSYSELFSKDFVEDCLVD